MAITTASAQVLTLFRRFAETGRRVAAQQQVQLIHVWKQALSTDPVTVLRTLVVMQVALSRVKVQIEESPQLDADSKSVGLGIIQGLEPIVNADLLQRNFAEIAPSVTNDRLGTLSLLSNTLRMNYSDPTLSVDEISEIEHQITELGEFIESTDISKDLKQLLLGHLAYMAWAITNIESLGVEAVYAAFAPAVLSARQAAGDDSISDTAKPRRKIYERFKEVVQRTIEMINLANKATEEFTQLEGGIQGLLPPEDQ